ncbi:hypothetical protein [Streptomyces salinarius]|uniref:hypothetical protein n=1 Tax=Streptomyces salinarius TaxID=2762598 RepID=UPI0013DA2449|nr:hypothetical protein [Streptomyces salinarius]
MTQRHEEGRARSDDVVEGHVRNRRRLLSGLDDHDREELDRVLRTLLVSLEGPR